MLSTARTVGRRGPIAFVILLIAAAAAACGGAASGILSTVGGPVDGGGFTAPGATAAPAPFPGTGSGEGETDGNGNVVYPAVQDRLIIKTGSLVLQVTGIDAALAAATQQITALGGYASGSQRSGDGEGDQATVTFRIPAAKWDDALVGLRSLATKILGEQTKSDDVTTQVIDLDARIKNLQSTERALQAIMDRAVEIKDVLAVQAELTTVRGQIEQMTAEMTNLQGQASYSTLTVTFSLKPDPVLTSQNQFDPKTEVDQASASLVGVLQGLATAGIWFAIVWLPILLGIGIVAGIGLFIFRRVRRVAGDPGAPAAPPTGSTS